MNNVCVTGNLTKDIEIRYNNEGKAFGNGTIAVKRDYKDQDGNYISDFFQFVAIGKQAEVMANYMSKGERIGIVGKLQNRVWEKDDGSKQYFTEIFVTSFDFPVRAKQQEQQEQPAQQPVNDPFANNGQAIDIPESDLPF